MDKAPRRQSKLRSVLADNDCMGELPTDQREKTAIIKAAKEELRETRIQNSQHHQKWLTYDERHQQPETRERPRDRSCSAWLNYMNSIDSEKANGIRDKGKRPGTIELERQRSEAIAIRHGLSLYEGTEFHKYSYLVNSYREGFAKSAAAYVEMAILEGAEDDIQSFGKAIIDNSGKVKESIQAQTVCLCLGAWSKHHDLLPKTKTELLKYWDEIEWPCYHPYFDNENVPDLNSKSMRDTLSKGLAFYGLQDKIQGKSGRKS